MISSLPATVLVAAGAMGIAALLLFWSFTSVGRSSRQHIVDNLVRDFGTRSTRVEPVEGAQRNVLVRAAYRLTPQSAVDRLQRLLAKAGRPARWPIERVLVTKLLLAVLFALPGLVLVSAGMSLRNIAVLVVLVVAGWFLPELLLWNHATKRQESIRMALPDVLDQLSIAVTAGLGFEAALAHVGRHSPGPLGDELIRTLQDIQVGSPRRTAYLEMADRARVDDLTRFVRAIIQAEQYGVSVASVLDAQARELRVKRRQRAEEAALKIPVKVVFPLTVFILPTLFIVVLGPAMLNAIEVFPQINVGGG